MQLHLTRKQRHLRQSLLLVQAIWDFEEIDRNIPFFLSAPMEI